MDCDIEALSSFSIALDTSLSCRIAPNLSSMDQGCWRSKGNGDMLGHVFKVGDGRDLVEDFTSVHTGMGVVEIERYKNPIFATEFVTRQFEGNAETVDELVGTGFVHSELLSMCDWQRHTARVYATTLRS